MQVIDRPCPLWRRLIALVYDLLAVVAIVMVVGYVCQRLTNGQLITTGAHVITPWWYQALQLSLVAAYFVVSWLRGGQTLGMRAWKTRVTSNNGQSPTLQQALIRVVVAALPLALLVLAPVLGVRGVLWAVPGAWALWFAVGLFDKRHRALHDLAAGTEIRLKA